MPLNLVNYSSSSSDEEISTENQNNKKYEKKILSVENSRNTNKLPNPFEKMKSVEEKDNTAEHIGKVRTFPHERGIWATYIYIQCSKTNGIIHLQREFGNLIKNTNLQNIDIHNIDEPHISLTRTLVLQHHWIDEFVRTIEKNLKNTPRFLIPLNTVKIYCNDNQTRTFVSLTFIETSFPVQQKLCDIVFRLDNSLSEFNLPSFYKEASFHVSILWCLGDRKTQLQLLIPEFCTILNRFIDADQTNFIISVDQLFCKIGNKLYNIKF